MSKQSLATGLVAIEFKHFDLHTLIIESEALKGNPLGDPFVRRNPVLVPKGRAPADGWPCVLVLSGFTGNGTNAFNVKTFERNAPQVIDQAIERGEAPSAVYVFCDAMTFWGGSQFIDSVGTGRYATYVLDDLCSTILQTLPVSANPEAWCVTGGSSGGYGALHLASLRPERFKYVAAIAPDSFFEASLLTEIRTAWPSIAKAGGVAGIKADLQNGKLLKRKEAHVVLNAIAMGICYAPDDAGGFLLPIDPQTGLVVEDVWSKWTAHDPIVFLKERATRVQKLAHVYLDVGTRDQFHLQYGTRQIRNVLKDLEVAVEYTEFEGNHFDIGERRIEAWKWLASNWR